MSTSRTRQSAAVVLLCLAAVAPRLPAGPESFPDDTYNVVWNSQSKNSSESMPCGGGDIGLNVWVEQGDIFLYLSRSGAFDENNLFPKLGRVRLRFSPSPFSEGTFRQELKLREGQVEIQGGASDSRLTMRIWVDVNRPVIHAQASSTKALSLEATYENWRFADHAIGNTEERHAVRGFYEGPVTPVIHSDTVTFANDGVTWYHRNRDSLVFDMTVEQEGLSSVKDRLWNPLKNLTFGGRMIGAGMKPAGEGKGRYASTEFQSWALKSAEPRTTHDLQIVLHVANAEELQQWIDGVRTIEREARANPGQAEDASKAWWADFWNRSRIVINPHHPAPNSPEWQVGRNYQLFRYQLGCNAHGDYPTKFNGGLFTFDPEYVDPEFAYTPDFRKWGGGSFTAQNQRLVYWPMLRSGDYDLLVPQLKFYERALRNAEIRSEAYWGIKGASFTEQMEQFGLPVAFEWGWNRSATAPVGVEHNAWLEYCWDTVFEFGQMALELQRYDDQDISPYLPFIDRSLVFFDEYYRRAALTRGIRPYDEKGHLVIYPGSGAETYKVAYNSTSTIAALQTVLQRLLELPDTATTREQRERWKEMAKRIPPIPFREMDGHKTIAPAITWARINNSEITQLYPVFPWGIYGVDKPDLQVAIDTWRYGVDRPGQRGYISWHQDNIFCARLGLTDEAAALTIKKLADARRRFPTFWGPGHDWLPDHNWGGSGMIGLQEMLMQTDGRKILLFPAWPKTWDVEFKLHAPYETTVEAELRDGVVARLKVTPAEREKDVQISLKR